MFGTTDKTERQPKRARRLTVTPMTTPTTSMSFEPSRPRSLQQQQHQTQANISSHHMSHLVFQFNDSGVKAYHRSDWKAAITSFTDAIQILEGNKSMETSDIHDIKKYNKHTAPVLASDRNVAVSQHPRQFHRDLQQRQTEYDEGMDCFQSPECSSILDVLSPASSSEDEMLYRLYFNMGSVKLKQSDDMAALEFFQKAQTKLQTVLMHLSQQQAPIIVGTTKAYKSFRLLHKIAYIYYRTGKHMDAMIHYHRALVLATTASLDAKIIAATLNCIGVVHFHSNIQGTNRTVGLFQQSLKLYRECLGNGVTTSEVATVLNNLGRAYFLQGKFQQSLTTYQEALSIRQRLLDSQSVDIAATVYNIAQVHQKLGNNDEALTLYHRFLSLMKAQSSKTSTKHHQSHGTNTPADREIAMGCRCIADVYQQCGKPKLAIPFLQDALRLTKKIVGLFHSEVASILNKLGNLLYEIRDYDTALMHYRDGLAVENAILSETHPHIIITLTNIGHILKQQRDYAGAVTVYKKVLDTQRKVSDEQSSTTNPLDLATTLSSLGLAQYHNEQYDDAFDSYQEALRIRRDQYGSDEHLDIASTLNSIGLVLFKQRSLELALSCFNASLSIRTKLLGPDHRDCAVLWYNLGTIQFEMGQDDIAIQLYKETLRIERAALGADHPDVVLTLQHLGQVHQQLGRLDESLDFFMHALNIERKRKQDKGDDDDDKDNTSSIAKMLNLIGNIHMQMGDISMMMKSFVEAARILDSRGDPNEVLLIAGYTTYGLSRTNPPAAPVA